MGLTYFEFYLKPELKLSWLTPMDLLDPLDKSSSQTNPLLAPD